MKIKKLYMTVIGLYICSCSSNVEIITITPEMQKNKIGIVKKERKGAVVSPEILESVTTKSIDQGEITNSSDLESALQKNNLYIKVTDSLEENKSAKYIIYGNACIFDITYNEPNISVNKYKNHRNPKEWISIKKYHVSVTSGLIDEKNVNCQDVYMEDHPLYTFNVPKSPNGTFVEIFISPEMEVRKE